MATPAEGASTSAAGRAVLDAARQRAHELVELAAAETRLAALSGLAMVLLVIVAAAALLVAWVLLVACVLYLFARSSIDWLVPALVMVAGHAALAYYLWQVAVRLSRNLTLPELRTTLLRKPVGEVRSDDAALVAGGP